MTYEHKNFEKKNSLVRAWLKILQNDKKRAKIIEKFVKYELNMVSKHL